MLVYILIGIKVPSPRECGLPEKFSAWRPQQEEGIHLMTLSPQRVVTLCAPTGWGKSAAVVAAAQLSGKPTCIVTRTRGLQDQYLRDFKSIGMVDLRGRQNYQCPLKPEYTCEEGKNARCPYNGSVACPASKAEIAAASSSLVVTNYAKWIAAKKFGQGMSHFQQVIFDECHNMPEALAEAMQVVLGYREIEEGLKAKFPQGADAEDMNYWRIWGQSAKADCETALIAANARITGARDPKPTWVKHYTHMKNLLRRLILLSTCKASDWIVEKTERGFQFDPIRPGKYAESSLLLRMPKILCVSATARPKTMYMSGISKGTFTFKEFASDFDPARSPIYYIPTMRVDYRADSLDMLWLKLDQIIAKRRGRKGIIHTISFARQQDILGRSRFSDMMIINEKGSAPSETIELFKKSEAGTVLVTPSCSEGYDFPDDQCRWQFICKVPFPPPSKILKAREQDDPEYRGYLAMQNLVQSFGRGMRSDTDYCENFICDTHLDWFLPKYRHLAPGWFHGFFKPVNTLPPPINF